MIQLYLACEYPIASPRFLTSLPMVSSVSAPMTFALSPCRHKALSFMNHGLHKFSDFDNLGVYKGQIMTYSLLLSYSLGTSSVAAFPSQCFRPATLFVPVELSQNGSLVAHSLHFSQGGALCCIIYCCAMHHPRMQWLRTAAVILLWSLTRLTQMVLTGSDSCICSQRQLELELPRIPPLPVWGLMPVVSQDLSWGCGLVSTLGFLLWPGFPHSIMFQFQQQLSQRTGGGCQRL